MEKEWNVIEVLRHARHDWLNKMQLIKGNLALNKVDRAKEILDEIVLDAQQEAKLSNLNIPQFAALLLTFNWENHFFQLEYEVLEMEQDTRVIRLDDEALRNWTASFFSCLNSSVKPYHDNHLTVSIQPQEQAVRFFFDFSGIIMNKQKLMQFLREDQYLDVNLHELSEMKLVLEVFVRS